jgi:hypothetical protein
MRRLMFTVATALSLAACGDSSSPTTPSPSMAITEWVVTQRFVSVTGPDNCWVRQQRATWTPAVFTDLPMTVTRDARSIMIEGEFFQVNYEGIVSGDAFFADGTVPLTGAVVRCRDGAGSFEQLPGASRLTGLFSGEQSMTATEVNRYELASGGTVTYTWGWQATRRN